MVNVVLDHDCAARLALTHLRQLGHERIAFMRGAPGITDAKYRWDSILGTAAKMGIPVRPELTIQLREVTQSPEAGYRHTQELLENTRDFTAMFCFNDISAIGAIRAIRDAGLRIPADISVVGFDDIITAAYCEPPLTTVKQPLREMGSRAAQILLARIAESDEEFPPEIVMEPELIVRDSTGPAPALNGHRSA